MIIKISFPSKHLECESMILEFLFKTIIPASYKRFCSCWFVEKKLKMAALTLAN